MITLDTSAVVALGNRIDPDHALISSALDAHRGPRVVPCGILAEIDWVLAARGGPAVADGFLAQLETRSFALDHGERHARIRHLVRRYADLRLGFADASVIACAEERGGRVLTLDRRHLEVVAREGTIEVLP